MPAAANNPQVAGEDLLWMDFTDFRAGIVGDRVSGTMKADGAGRAYLMNFGTSFQTSGCVADPSSGMLMPLPAVSATKTATQPPPADLTGNAGAGTYYPTNNGSAFVLDARVIGPMIGTTDLDRVPTSGGRADALAILWGFWYNTSGTGTNFREYVLGRLYQGNVATPWGTTVDFHFQKNTVDVSSFPRSLPIGSLEMTRTVPSTVSPPFNISQLHPVLAFSTAFPRTLPQTAAVAIAAADQALTTFDTDIGATYAIGASPAATTPSSVHGLYPSPDAAAASVKNLPLLSQSCLMLVAHQGRLVAVSSLPWAGFDYPRNLSVPMDYLGYNPEPGQIAAAAGVTAYNFLNAVDENPSGIGTAASLNANTLFAVKHYGGGYLVQGDLDNPDVIRLPFIHSTQGIVSRGCYTPMGYAYLGRNGVYAYKGGDATQPLTPQLDGLHLSRTQGIGDPVLPWWDPRGTNQANELYAGAVGRLAWWDPFIVIPNGWLLDTRTNAMWRLRSHSWTEQSPGDAFYDVSPASGDLFAVPYKLNNQSTVVFRVYPRDGAGATSYFWVSQPVVASRDRMVELREVELEAISSERSTDFSQPNTVTLGFYGTPNTSDALEGTLLGTATFTWSSGSRSQRARIPVTPTTAGAPARGRNITVTVSAVGGGGPAPKVAFRIGYREGSEAKG